MRLKSLPRQLLATLIFSVFSGFYPHYCFAKSMAQKPLEETTPEKKATYDCPSTREFITTFNYLLEGEYVKLNKKQAQVLALRVAKGCNGAAKRFIRVFKLLARVGLANPSAVKIAAKFALWEDPYTDVFIQVFKSAYLKSHLDLDLSSSIRLAESLSIGFKGNILMVKDDYIELTEFCLAKDGLNIPRSKCARMVERTIKYGEHLKKKDDEGIAPLFIKLFSFLSQSDRGPLLATYEALDLTHKVMAISPYAGDNFIMAYRFALSKRGLGVTRNAAIGFAQKLAAATVKL